MPHLQDQPASGNKHPHFLHKGLGSKQAVAEMRIRNKDNDVEIYPKSHTKACKGKVPLHHLSWGHTHLLKRVAKLTSISCQGRSQSIPRRSGRAEKAHPGHTCTSGACAALRASWGWGCKLDITTLTVIQTSEGQ